MSNTRHGRRAAENLQVPASTFGEGAEAIIDAMVAAGFEIAVVGGPVRDHFAGKAVKDVDLTTNARPDQTRAVLQALGSIYDVGAKYGTVGVAIDGDVYEVTTYRTEQYTADSRKPEVAYGDSLEEDLTRRDFTINAMAFAADGAGLLRLVDPFGGREDLKAGVIRCVGNPEERFSEDPLRIVRAWRFSILRYFEIHPETGEAAHQLAHRLGIVSRPRITAELVRVLDDADRGEDTYGAAARLGIAETLFGPFTHGFEAMRPSVDPGPLRRGGGHVERLHVAAQHAGMDAEAVHASIDELRLPREVGDGIVTRMRLAAATKDAARRGDDLQLRLTVRRLLRNGRADTVAAVAASSLLSDAEASLLGRLAADASVAADLPINGHDLMSAGLKGPEVGKALAQVETVAVTRPVTREEAMRIALGA